MDEILEKLIDIDVSTQKITDEWNKKWDNSEKYVPKKKGDKWWKNLKLEKE